MQNFSSRLLVSCALFNSIFVLTIQLRANQVKMESHGTLNVGTKLGSLNLKLQHLVLFTDTDFINLCAPSQVFLEAFRCPHLVRTGSFNGNWQLNN